MILELLGKLENPLGGLAIERHGILRDHRDLAACNGHILPLQALSYLFKFFRTRHDLEETLLLALILGAGVQGEANQLILINFSLIDRHQTLLVEHPCHTAALAQIPSVPREDMAGLPNRAVS